ncbi:molecular chaperone DnaJ [Bowdeniella nasicola]|uniref:Chaperone protein DnaJ n=1 Tax=Bowdeniella nasicola TaxID=208480 RepID=A0A1H3W5C2_9ACTO|nr:molecular chaperone DnaJ [Bowdeniella nasicola]SDZ81634.1 molecular chaperone DnaJ [Bowdeniella nasicola]
MRNYYDILGVSQQASTEEIKRAYRKLARKLHPDVAGPGSEDEFKEVQRAYDVLSNAEKRQMYDLGGESAFSGGMPGGGFGGFSDFFDTFFSAATGGGSAHGPVPRGRRGQDALVRLDITLADAVFGTSKDIQVDTAVVCSTCQGTCCAPGTSPVTCSTCGGRGSVQRVARSFLGQVMTTAPCPECRGHGTIIETPCTECSGDGRVRTRTTITVDIPAGVDSGTRIRMTGRGEVGPGGGPAGDLYIETHVRAHPVFARQGDDLHCTLTIPMTAAALGTVITLETLDGERDITIAPGTPSGHVEVLRGLGVTHLRSAGRGDLLCHLDVAVPTNLTDRQQELLAELAELRGEERVEPKIAPASSVFSRLREKIGL